MIPSRWQEIRPSDALRMHMAYGNYMRLWLAGGDDESRDEYYALVKELGLSFRDAECLAFDVAENWSAFRDAAAVQEQRRAA